jgi:uncharacterized membrane protein YdjX (TVP38/TMEM64 family)
VAASEGYPVRHYLMAAAAVLVFFLALFLVGEALGLPLLEDPTPWLRQAGWLSAAIGVGLLAADVLLPVPSNVVMIAHGALFGIVVGAALSVLGSMLATAAAFWIGRRGGTLLAKAVPVNERARADAILAHWGVVAIMVTRPLPLLAETLIVLAGASHMSWRTAMLSSLVGFLPPSLFYAWAGAMSIGFEGGVLIFGLTIVLAAVSGLAVRRLEQRHLHSTV